MPSALCFESWLGAVWRRDRGGRFGRGALARVAVVGTEKSGCGQRAVGGSFRFGTSWVSRVRVEAGV